MTRPDPELSRLVRFAPALVALGAAGWGIGCTVVAFGGGVLPMIRVEVEGGLIPGFLWLGVFSPLAVFLAYALAHFAATRVEAYRASGRPGLGALLDRFEGFLSGVSAPAKERRRKKIPKVSEKTGGTVPPVARAARGTSIKPGAPPTRIRKLEDELLETEARLDALMKRLEEDRK